MFNSDNQFANFFDLNLLDNIFNVDQNMPPPVSPYADVISRCVSVIHFGNANILKIRSSKYYEQLFKLPNSIDMCTICPVTKHNVCVVNICFKSKKYAEECIQRYGCSIPNIRIKSASDILISTAKKANPGQRKITAESAFHQIYHPAVPVPPVRSCPNINFRPNLRVVNPIRPTTTGIPSLMNSSFPIPSHMRPNIPQTLMNNQQTQIRMPQITPQSAVPQTSYSDMLPSTSYQQSPMSAPPDFGSQPSLSSSIFPFSSSYGCTSNNLMDTQMSNFGNSFPNINHIQSFAPNNNFFSN